MTNSRVNTDCHVMRRFAMRVRVTGVYVCVSNKNAQIIHNETYIPCVYIPWRQRYIRQWDFSPSATILFLEFTEIFVTKVWKSSCEYFHLNRSELYFFRLPFYVHRFLSDFTLWKFEFVCPLYWSRHLSRIFLLDSWTASSKMHRHKFSSRLKQFFVCIRHIVSAIFVRISLLHSITLDTRKDVYI